MCFPSIPTLLRPSPSLFLDLQPELLLKSFMNNRTFSRQTTWPFSWPHLILDTQVEESTSFLTNVGTQLGTFMKQNRNSVFRNIHHKYLICGWYTLCLIKLRIKDRRKKKNIRKIYLEMPPSLYGKRKQNKTNKRSRGNDVYRPHTIHEFLTIPRIEFLQFSEITDY